MYVPTLDELLQMRKEECADSEDRRRPLLPICYDLLADMETPVSAYCKTARGPYTKSGGYSFLLESIEGGERIARYSFIGIDPYLVMTQRGDVATLNRLCVRGGSAAPVSTEQIACYDPLDFIQAELGQYRLIRPAGMAQDKLPSFYGGAVGYLAYETTAHFERLPIPEHDELGLPLAMFCFTATVLAFDHLKRRVRIVTHLHLDAPDLEACPL